MTIEFDKDGYSLTSGTVTVYNISADTKECIGKTEEFITVGTGLPAHAYLDEPLKAKKGFAVCRTINGEGWEYVADHRGETVFSTKTGEKINIAELGDYPADSTTKAPATPYDTWSGNEWATNTEARKAAESEAAKQQKTALLASAQAAISIWQTELQLGIISDKDKTSLIAWINHIRAVQAIDTSLAPSIEWPASPE
ncbi:tail fiber assembly protein [Yersinia kristensenii]|uniref:Phage tail protein n=1 Tax=Yersinia kristensenii TaxID=28152 RepID=A0AB73Q656_YERKR|nr:tail fiber assembly protein [Yersinia kristensenii]OVZ81105.1 phage tail protein [Yersinia kristensenii]